MPAVQPMFTVVLPTYNRSRVVMRAVDSVLSQTFADFELIVVDDLSSDDTQSVLATVDDPRFLVAANQRRKGVSGARNTGIDLARGRWICQIDSDDEWPKDMLEKLASGIETAPPDVGIVYGSLAYVDAQTNRITNIRPAERRGFVQAEFLEDHFIHHCSAAMLSSAVREAGGYDESFRSKEDSDLLLRLTERYAIYPVPGAMYLYRLYGGDQVSRPSRSFLDSYEQYMQKHQELLLAHPKARHQLRSNILVLSARAGDWSRFARTWLQLAPSLLQAPGVFGKAHLRLAGHAIESGKKQLLPVARRLGLRN